MTKNTSTAPAQPELRAQKWSPFYFKTKFVLGFLEKQQQKNPQSRTTTPRFFPLLLKSLFNLPLFHIKVVLWHTSTL